MAISIKEHILAQATQLQQRLEQEKPRVDTLIPSEQIYAATQFIDDSALLTALQQKVNATYLGGLGAIPEINDEELAAISEKLNTATDILASFDQNIDIAMAYQDIATEVNYLYTSIAPNVGEVQSLLGRIRVLTTENSYVMNSGNRNALEVVNQALQALLTQPSAPRTTQPPVAQNPSNRRSSQPVLSDNQRIIQANEEEFQASQFRDQYKDIEKTLTKDPVKDFEKILNHYTEVKRYALFKTSYVSETAGHTNLAHLDQLEQLMDRLMQIQAEKEGRQGQQARVRAGFDQAYNSLRAAYFRALKTSIEKLISAIESKAADVSSFVTEINDACRKIGPEEIGKLFDAFNQHLLTLKQRKLSDRYKDQPLNMWPGTWQQKKEALDKLMSASNDPTTPAAAVVKESDKMKKAFRQAVNMLPSAPSRSDQATHRPSPSEDTDFPEDFDFTQLHFEDVVPNSEVRGNNVHPNVEVLLSLQALLVLLGPDANGHQLQQACNALQIMDSQGHKSIFKMSDANPRAIADRPCFHIYFIHKNETPDILINDGQYGNKAFAGAYPATNKERSRAVQRTIVELALGTLEDEINSENGATVGQLLDILEGVKLDPKDRVNGQENAAYNLFRAFYQLHVAARNSNTSLIDPHDPQFQGDFGRKAFHKLMNGIDPAIKSAAIDQIRNALKTVWKV